MFKVTSQHNHCLVYYSELSCHVITLKKVENLKKLNHHLYFLRGQHKLKQISAIKNDAYVATVTPEDIRLFAVELLIDPAAACQVCPSQRRLGQESAVRRATPARISRFRLKRLRSMPAPTARQRAPENISTSAKSLSQVSRSPFLCDGAGVKR